jgi:steroid delta-isomerase-like uncharacterized protein
MTTATRVLQKIIEAVNRHDPAAFAALYAADAVLYDPQYSEPLRGRAEIEKDMADMIRAFPDLQFSIKSSIEAGDRQATEWMVSGTNQGPLAFPTGEVPPTGRSLEMGGSDFARYNSNGEIAESHRYYDIAGWLRQLGIEA